MNQTLTAALPRWQLDSIYPGLDAPELAADVAALHGVLDETEAFWDARGVRGGRRASDPAADLATLAQNSAQPDCRKTEGRRLRVLRAAM